MRKIKLSDIKISKRFLESVPREDKMKDCREIYEKYNNQDRYIVIDYDNILIDGYIQYLILKEKNVEEAQVKISNVRKKRWKRKDIVGFIKPTYKKQLTTYIYGTHLNSRYKKEFVWRVPSTWNDWDNNLFLGDIVTVRTRFANRSIVVTKIEKLEHSPLDESVKIRKITSKNIKKIDR